MISVIVPVYNVELYLRECIESVLAQTLTDIEIIIVDDGSKDDSGMICDSFTDPRIKVFHTENHGLSAARNFGISHSSGEYIYFIDSDDWIEPNVLERAMINIGSADILCFENCAGVYTGREALVAHINGKISVTSWDKLYKRECLSAIRFPEGRIMEDSATTYLLLDHSKKVICIENSGYHYRKRKGSICDTRDMANLIGLWTSYKERYEYCWGLLDGSARINLLKSCAVAIARSWGWRCSIGPLNVSSSPAWEEMAEFTRSKFQRSVRRYFPLRIRRTLVLARYNKPWAFRVANYLNKLHIMMNNLCRLLRTKKRGSVTLKILKTLFILMNFFG